MNGLTVGEMPKDLCHPFKELRLEILLEGHLATLDVQPTLMDIIGENRKTDKVMEEIRTNLSRGKAKGFW